MTRDILPPPPSNIKSYLLLASPILHGSIFEKSCILITEKSEKGHEGFILNHKTKESVSDLVSHTKGTPVGKLPVFFGGPVQSDSLHFIALSKYKEKLQFATNISIDHANFCLEEEDSIVLPCLGYSEWSKGQLENEFEHHTWFYKKALPSIIKRQFNLRLWKSILSSISPYHKLIANAPPSPLSN